MPERKRHATAVHVQEHARPEAVQCQTSLQANATHSSKASAATPDCCPHTPPHLPGPAAFSKGDGKGAAAASSASTPHPSRQISYMPFSEGPRSCVGQTLAKLEVGGQGVGLRV